MNNLSIITIGFKNNDDFVVTSKSLMPVIMKGVKNIVQDGGGTFDVLADENQVYFFEKDKGIFDALNKGIEKITTKYFMLVHSGDQLLLTDVELQERLQYMDRKRLDILLGDQLINTGNSFRLHRGKYWRPWQLKFGNQPPHMPTIYRTSFAREISYNIENKVIGDFEYFEDLFSLKPKWEWFNGKVAILMGPGGNTSSGFKSFFFVSKNFISQYGYIRGLILVLGRIPFKLIMMIR